MILKNKYFIISFGIIFISILTNLGTYGIDSLTKKNVYDIFLKYVIEGGLYSAVAALLASIIPSFDCYSHKEVQQSKVTFTNRYYSKGFRVGMVFVIANVSALFIFYIFASKSAVYTGLNLGDYGTFGSLRLIMPFAYILIYIINCFLFGFCMSVFSQCIYDFLEEKYMTIIISILYYYSYLFLPFDIESSPYYGYFVFLFPGFSYNFIRFDISVIQRFLGFTFILIISFLLHLITNWKKYHYEAPVNGKENIRL